MLEITIPQSSKWWDETNEVFVDGTPEQKVKLEHSLLSLSRWESKWKKPFLDSKEKTYEETIDYFRCMAINQVDPKVFYALTQQNVNEINAYINDPMTATWFTEHEKTSKNKEVITSEIIYYWMVAYQIPFSCEKWNLNRLITLIRVCDIKNQPPKKMSKKDVMSRNRSLNAARRNATKSKG